MSAFAAVAEKHVGVTSGAKTANENILRAQTCGEELRSIRLRKVEVHIARRGLVARWRHAEPLQRIGLIAGARLIEIFRRIGELRGELGDEFRANFIATGADGGAERGEQIGGLAAEFEAQAAHSLFGDAGKCALPTRMNCGDSAFFGIHDKDGHAIGGLHGEEHAGAIRHGGVALAGERGRGAEQADRVGVDLFERREREIFGAECSLQKAAILGDVFARVPFHEAEIQHRLAIKNADAAWARAETVDEPREFAEWRELQDFQAAGTVHDPGRREKQRAPSSAFAYCRLFRG